MILEFKSQFCHILDGSMCNREKKRVREKEKMVISQPTIRDSIEREHGKGGRQEVRRGGGERKWSGPNNQRFNALICKRGLGD